jgi:hypothetical protein
MKVLADVNVFTVSTQWVHGRASFSVDCSVISLEMYTILSLLLFILFYPQC